MSSHQCDYTLNDCYIISHLIQLFFPGSESFLLVLHYMNDYIKKGSLSEPLLHNISVCSTTSTKLLNELFFTGEMGYGPNTGKPLHYKGSIFHRIIRGFMAQVCSYFSVGFTQLSFIIADSGCLQFSCCFKLDVIAFFSCRFCLFKL